MRATYPDQLILLNVITLVTSMKRVVYETPQVRNSAHLLLVTLMHILIFTFKIDKNLTHC